MWGIMEAFSEPGVHDVTIQSCTQIGKSEILLNLIGFYSHQDPSPILMVQPTVDLAKAFSKERVAPMVRDTPALRQIFPDPKSRNSGNQILHKEYPGGFLAMTGANAPSGLASRPIRVLLFDEVDRYPLSAGTEGDVMSIARKRTATFWNRLIVAVSSPTDKESSNIEAAEQHTDQRRYHVACPMCHVEQVLTWAHVGWPKGRPDAAQIACESCGALWSEAERQQAIRQAMLTGWRATRPDAQPGVVGFHVPEMLSMWRTPAEMAIDWTKAQSSTEKLRTFVNTSLAETFEIPADVLDGETFYNRREHYALSPGQVVPNGSHLTAAVDVQDDRLEAEIVSWGAGEESWGVEYMVFMGSPGQARVWSELENWLNAPRYRVDNAIMDTPLVLIDSGGHFTDETYAFCRRNPRRYVPTKGSSEMGKPLATFPRTMTKDGVFLTIIGPDTGKELVFDRVRLTDPGPGYWHWPVLDCYDREYFDQLCGEKRERHKVRGRIVYRWVPVRRRNEALDIRVLSMAAVRLLQSIGRITLETLADTGLSDPSPQPPSMSSARQAPRQPRRQHPRRRGLFGDS